MNRLFNLTLVLLLSLVILNTNSIAQEESHVLITIYPGSTLRGTPDIAQFDEYKLWGCPR
ncbi:MAG: hypothetical protein ACERKJ_01745 [Candidatus Dadabacteria bacterium]